MAFRFAASARRGEDAGGLRTCRCPPLLARRGGLLLLRRGFSGERRRRCRQHFPLRRQPVLIGLTVGSAMCGPDLVGTLADTVFQTLIHVKLSCFGGGWAPLSSLSIV